MKTPYEQKAAGRERRHFVRGAYRAACEPRGRSASSARSSRRSKASTWRDGAMAPGYPSIVGSGPNATTLHYSASIRPHERGRSAARRRGRQLQGTDRRHHAHLPGERHGSRRSSARFTSWCWPRRMRASKPRESARRTLDIERPPRRSIRDGLLKLGLITDATGPQYRTWYTHGICHWIGMDVHDVGDYRRPLEPGMAFVIEPGLYIRPEALEQLPDTPRTRLHARRSRPAVRKYRGSACASRTRSC